MKAPPFEYHTPTSVEEALGLLSDLGDEAKVLAGGQSLVPLMALRLARPEVLLDINGVPGLAGVDTTDGLTCGALVRHRTLERNRDVAAGNPLLSAAARYIGHTAIRNRGTFGGSVSHADPAAEIPAVLVALDAEIHASSAHRSRTIAASEFFQGFLTTALEPDEMVISVRLPPWDRTAGWSFREFSRRHGDFAVAGAAVKLALDDQGLIEDVRIGLSGMSDTPVRGAKAEAVVRGREPSQEAWIDAGAEAVAGLEPPSDLHGSSAYRRHLASGLVQAALQEAHGRAEIRV